MVEIADIRDERSLKEWLAERRNKDIEMIAYRAVMRVVPILWNHVCLTPKSTMKSLPVLRSCLIAGVKVNQNSSAIDAARAAASAATAHALNSRVVYTAANKTESSSAAARRAGAAHAAASASYKLLQISEPAHISDTVSIAGRTSMTVSTVMGGSNYTIISAWNSIQEDCQALESGRSPLNSPLWSEKKQAIGALWNSVSKQWATRDHGWEFWRDWYQNALDGVKPNWDMLTKIALIEPEDWDRGADHVNGLIAEIQLEYAVAATPNAEDIIVNEDGKYQAVSRSDLPAQTLSDVQDRLRDVIAQIRRAQQQENNQYAPLVDEADLLEHTLARYGENALRMFETCSKVTAHIGTNVSSGVLPENDNLVGDVISDVQNSADDIYSFDAQVKAAIDARNQRRYERLSDEEKANIVLLAEATAQNSVGPLAEELREDANAVQGEDEPNEETTVWRYRLASRITRMRAKGGEAFRNVGEAIILLGGIGGGAAVFWAIIRALIGF